MDEVLFSCFGMYLSVRKLKNATKKVEEEKNNFCDFFLLELHSFIYDYDANLFLFMMHLYSFSFNLYVIII